VAPGDFPVTPGLWWNPARSGTGWDIIRNGSTMHLVWLTYSSNGAPTWLQTTPVAADSSTVEWTAPLYRFTWPSGQPAPIGSEVGSVGVRFLANDPGRIAIRWAWGSNSADECIVDYSRTGGTQPTAPSGNVNALYSGHWYEPTHDGYGDVVRIILRQHDFQYIENHALLIYDVNGAPVWVQSQAERGGNPPAGNRWETSNLLYFSSPFGVPTAANWEACQQSSCIQSRAAGSQARYFQSSIAMLSGFEAVVTAPPSGAAAVSFKRGRLGGSLASGQAPAEWKQLNKLSVAEGIVVDRYSCSAAVGQSQCTVVVNWHSDVPGTRAYRTQTSVGPNQNLRQLIPPGLPMATGEYNDNLAAGHAYRFELREPLNKSREICFDSTTRSDELRVWTS